MAGTPIRNAQQLYLDAHEVEVMRARADGASWKEVARQFHTSNHVLNLWLKSVPERWVAWKALEEIAAESRAADARDILDAAQGLALSGVSSPELTRLAIARSDLAKWEAGVMARGRFGAPSAAGASITVNVGALHLTAVKDLAANPPPAPAGLIEDAEYEVLPPARPAAPAEEHPGVGALAMDLAARAATVPSAMPTLDAMLG